jgi:hypothetical protein
MSSEPSDESKEERSSGKTKDSSGTLIVDIDPAEIVDTDAFMRDTEAKPLPKTEGK